jgi:hypothetical protein
LGEPLTTTQDTPPFFLPLSTAFGYISAAIQGGASETVAKILAGHKIKGMSDAYVKRNPSMVREATEAIEHHYFRDSNKLPSSAGDHPT